MTVVPRTPDDDWENWPIHNSKPPHCHHLFRHLRTQKITEGVFEGNRTVIANIYILIDTFYCQHCLELKTVRQEKRVDIPGRIPEWYREL